MRSCWRPSPRAAASGESCERPARSVRGEGRRVGERPEVRAGWGKGDYGHTGPSTSSKKFLVDLNIHELSNCGSLKFLNSGTSSCSTLTKKKKKEKPRLGRASCKKAGDSRNTASALMRLTDSLSILKKTNKPACHLVGCQMKRSSSTFLH